MLNKIYVSLVVLYAGSRPLPRMANTRIHVTATAKRNNGRRFIKNLKGGEEDEKKFVGPPYGKKTEGTGGPLGFRRTSTRRVFRVGIVSNETVYGALG